MLNIVGTPIGNLEDLSVRQVRVISQAEVLLTEDTRSTGLLLKKITELFHVQINPNQRLISYYKENEFEKLPEILELIQEGKEISLISQAGMPLVSDPGYLLVTHLIKKNLPFTVVPGPTASINALIYAGANPSQYMFIGFLPKNSSEISKLFKKLQTIKTSDFTELPIVFYESPNRIQKTLEIIDSIWPDATISVSRELTKKFEETIRGKAKELLTVSFKGELTVVLS